MPKITLEDLQNQMEDVLERQNTIENLLNRLLRALKQMHIPDKSPNQAGDKDHES